MKGYLVSKKKSLEQFLEKNKAFTLPIILAVGFIIDTLTLGQVDRVFDNVVIAVHLFIAATSIALLFSVDSRLGRKLRIKNKDSIISAIMLFSFGGLFSGFAVFYAKSGSLISSWPFILVLMALMLGTEIRKKYFMNMILQISIFYIAFFSYLIFSLPVIVHKMGPVIYMISGLISLIFISAYLFLLSKINKGALTANRNKIIARIISIFVIFNILYFANIIPPIPLSLKFRAVYHDFSRIQSIQYRGSYEPAPTWEFWRNRNRVFHRQGNEPVYVYTQIYAPVDLSIDLYHKWEYFDPAKTRWVEESRIKIPITGGRANGYRGYSQKQNVWPGSWRVKVITSRGQTVGEIRFKIKDAEVAPKLVPEVFN